MLWRGRTPQPEAERRRKQQKLRLLPTAIASLRAHAAADGVRVSEFVERWILTLPRIGSNDNEPALSSTVTGVESDPSDDLRHSKKMT